MAVLCKQLICARSDGQSHYRDGSKKKKNEPDKQNSAPKKNGELDYYELLKPDDPTYLDWMKKLGGMIAVSCNIRDKYGNIAEFNCILKELPEDYNLWKHHKTTVENGKLVQTRVDTYLYGYPMGKSRFRSPQEFLPHLLWLMTDPEGDCFNNCSCRFCHPEAMPLTRPKKPAATKEDVKDKSDEKKPEPESGGGNGGSVAQQSKAKMPATSAAGPSQRQLKQEPTPVPQPSSQAKNKQAQAPASQAFVSQQVQSAGSTSAEHNNDLSSSNTYIYRPGELVWYHKNPAWGLALVLSRKTVNSTPFFLLQPLSHPFAPAPQAIRSNTASDLRPWLAWSVPPISFAQIKDMPFENVPWDRIANGEFGGAAKNSVEVDAAIMGAKAMNASYTPFAPAPSRSTKTDTHYDGLFLGGEKFWTGEAVRVTISMQGESGDENRIMVISSFIEKSTPNQAPELYLTGQIFTYTIQPLTPKLRRTRNWPFDAHLPARIAQDTAFRNNASASLPSSKTFGEWRLISTNSTISWRAVKGRWYESRLLLPILRGQGQFDDDVRKGEVGDCGACMNARTLMMGGSGNRRFDRREEAVGGAVPAGVQVIEGEGGFEVPGHMVFPA